MTAAKGSAAYLGISQEGIGISRYAEKNNVKSSRYSVRHISHI